MAKIHYNTNPYSMFWHEGDKEDGKRRIEDMTDKHIKNIIKRLKDNDFYFKDGSSEVDRKYIGKECSSFSDEWYSIYGKAYLKRFEKELEKRKNVTEDEE